MASDVHRLSAGFVLGFHGCDKKTAEKLIGGDEFVPSNNEYDWLGPGIYFWESNPERALEFAQEVKARGPKRNPQIKTPAVVGAVIDLGYCLDLTTSAGARSLVSAYEGFSESMQLAGAMLPVNGPNIWKRNLDCAVISWFHDRLKKANGPPVDTVRAPFIEGEELFPGSAFRAKSHIQICVQKAECIKGVFRVPKHVLGHT